MPDDISEIPPQKHIIEGPDANLFSLFVRVGLATLYVTPSNMTHACRCNKFSCSEDSPHLSQTKSRDGRDYSIHA